MSDNYRKVGLAAFLLAILAVTAVAHAEAPDYKPPAREALLTPRFCWKQFMGSKFSEPQFRIPRRTCGAFVNHYCYALIDLNRANRTFGDQGKRRAYLMKARKDTLYTLRGIKPYPRCPIRAHVENTLRAIDAQLGAIR